MFNEPERIFTKNAPAGFPRVDPGWPVCYIRNMELMELWKVNAAKVVLCPAVEVEAGVVSGSIEYTAGPLLTGQVLTERDGEPELAGCVEDRERFLRALDRAVQTYVDWSARFHYLKKQVDMFSETRFRFVPTYRYRVVLWVDSVDGGYVFHFKPLRVAGKVSSAVVAEGAHMVHVSGESLDGGV